jgi:hypothetical protein
VLDVDELADDNDTRFMNAAHYAGALMVVACDKWVLGWGEKGNMHVLSPSESWLMMFAQ